MIYLDIVQYILKLGVRIRKITKTSIFFVILSTFNSMSVILLSEWLMIYFLFQLLKSICEYVKLKDQNP